MKHEFSKAALVRAALFAGIGLALASPVACGAPLEAAQTDDNKAIRKLSDVPAPRIGERMRDGTVYAGISPDSGKPIYAAVADAPLTMRFGEAADYAKNLQVHGHNDWQLPTRNELKLMFDNRAAIGGFTTALGSDFAHWYWSATELPDNPSRVYVVDFTDGFGDWGRKDYVELSSRVVRAEP